MTTAEFPPALFAACVTPLETPQLYDAACAAVSPARRQKADRFRFPEDRRLCLGAELLLRYVLRVHGAEFPDEFVYGPQGKPQLPEGSLQFSLSHSGDWVICAAGSCAVGCDIEKIAPVDLRVANRFFSPGEAANIAAQPTPEARTELFYRYWVLKESFLKAVGLGLSLPMDTFEILRQEEILVRQSADDRIYRFREYPDIPGCCCALCAAGEIPDPHLRVTRLDALF